MTEPPVKKRTLTKVRKQYLHTRPSDEDGIGDRVELPPTPEQLNEDTIRLLDPSLVLVETHRNIYAGQQFLNLNYKVTSQKVERQFGVNVVSLDLKVNNVDILPLEYCVKRLKSYGDLELATWADRLVTYHSNYSQAMKKYFDFVNSENPMVRGALTLAKEHALSVIKDIESKYVYRKGTVHGSKDGLVPVSLTFHEGLIKYMDYNLDNFVELAREQGIPSLFKKDCSALINNWKQALARSDRKAGLNQEGETFTVDLCTKEGEKKSVNMKVFTVINPGPEGFFVHHYSVFEDLALDVLNNSKTSQNFESLDDKKDIDGDSKCKKVKKRNSEISDQISEVREEETKVNSSIDM